KSGSLITASLGLQENRDIYAVPGPITSKLSAGPNQLIEAGATPIVDFKFKNEKI
ncbi:DNA-protecting protein DprA, partial [Lactobacillus helveticus]